MVYRDAGAVGRTGRLRELFDFLAGRGHNADSASQAEIAQEVFGQVETDADDATVRVYVHRLRKKLEDHYLANPPAAGQRRIDLPAGIYALRLIDDADAQGGAEGEADKEEEPPAAFGIGRFPLLAVLAAAVLAAFAAGWLLNRSDAAPRNEIWEPLEHSDRPVLLVLGDYYLFGEIDPVFPEEGRLIRDFRVNSAEDLLALQEADPDRYGFAEDVGLNYLPFQTSYALQSISPLLAMGSKEVAVIPASELTSEQFNSHDLVYVGLLSGMGLLEEVSFGESSLRIGESYDEIIDRESGERWVSDEARRLASTAFYRDYAYISRFAGPGGALVTIIASERVTGLRGIGPIVASGDLETDLAQAAGSGGFEALIQVTGQQGADLSDRLILARER